MSVAGGLLVESEEFSQFTQREVTLHILLLVHHAAAQGFLMGLPLQDLLLDGPGLSAHSHKGNVEFSPAVCSLQIYLVDLTQLIRVFIKTKTMYFLKICLEAVIN